MPTSLAAARAAIFTGAINSSQPKDTKTKVMITDMGAGMYELGKVDL